MIQEPKKATPKPEHEIQADATTWWNNLDVFTRRRLEGSYQGKSHFDIYRTYVLDKPGFMPH